MPERSQPAAGRPGLAAFAIPSAFALIALLGARPLWHDDLFFHLRTGEMFVRTGVVPTVDSFTHTVPGAAWTSHEWGFGLLLYAFFQLGGLAALLWLMPVLLLCTFLAIFAQMRSVIARERLWVAAPLLALGVAAGEPTCLVLRAALITALGLALTSLLLRRYYQHGRRRDLVWLGVVFLVWANMHAGVAFGLFVVGLHVLQALVDAWRSRGIAGAAGFSFGAPRKYALLTLGCAAITLLNPSGLELWTFPFRVNEILYRSGLVYNMGQYARPDPAQYPAFFALVALCLLACLPWSRLRAVLSDRTRPAVAQLLALLFFAVLALRSNRFIAECVVFALPFCAAAWGGEVVPAPRATGQRAGVRRMLLGVAGLTVVVALFVALRPGLPRRTLARDIPVGLADFMQQRRVEGRMLNPEAFGGYLGWRLRQPVYWDGRNDIFLPVAREWAHTKDLALLAQRHALDVLVFDRVYQRKFGAYVAAHRDAWALVYWDDVSALYLKRIPRFLPLIERHQYRLLEPFGTPSEQQIERLAKDAGLRRAVEHELERVLSQADQTSAAWYLRGRIAQASGEHRAAYAALGRAAELAPDDGLFLYHLARAARDVGQHDQARMLLERVTQARSP